MDLVVKLKRPASPPLRYGSLPRCRRREIPLYMLEGRVRNYLGCLQGGHGENT